VVQRRQTGPCILPQQVLHRLKYKPMYWQELKS